VLGFELKSTRDRFRVGGERFVESEGALVPEESAKKGKLSVQGRETRRERAGRKEGRAGSELMRYELSIPDQGVDEKKVGLASRDDPSSVGGDVNSDDGVSECRESGLRK